ncbi:MAG: FtsW/RodA/SpoVE family cell cycle protein [Ignavibacteriaceae bacterium]|nr:FtsW/RodA/SpoVE family cell cycle protein [Ignavibacteriaceae bacterium]
MLISPLAHYFYNNVLESYQKQRIETFLGTNNSEELYQNEDFNRQMSILAVGSGRVFGKGFLNGNIVNSRLLPFAYTDFAFAGFSEQFGFAGSMLIIALYFLLFIHIFRVYYRTKNTFYKLLCIGTIALIFFNSAQHIAMNLGLTPITGVPLPLISYGGSSILATFIALGIINSIDTVKDSEVQINKLDSNYGFGIES